MTRLMQHDLGRRSSFSRSPSISLATGMPVQRADDVGRSPHRSRVSRSRSCDSFLASAIFSSSASCFLQVGQLAVFAASPALVVVAGAAALSQFQPLHSATSSTQTLHFVDGVLLVLPAGPSWLLKLFAESRPAPFPELPDAALRARRSPSSEQLPQSPAA